MYPNIPEQRIRSVFKWWSSVQPGCGAVWTQTMQKWSVEQMVLSGYFMFVLRRARHLVLPPGLFTPGLLRVRTSHPSLPVSANWPGWLGARCLHAFLMAVRQYCERLKWTWTKCLIMRSRGPQRRSRTAAAGSRPLALAATSCVRLLRLGVLFQPQPNQASHDRLSPRRDTRHAVTMSRLASQAAGPTSIAASDWTSGSWVGSRQGLHTLTFTNLEVVPTPDLDLH